MKTSKFLFGLSAFLMIQNYSFGQQRAVDDVRNIVETFCSSQGVKKNTPKMSSGSMSVIRSSSIMDDYGLSESNESFYICSDRNEGFVIVSADEKMPEILGYSTSGNISRKEDIPDNLMYVLEGYAYQKANIARTQYLPKNAAQSVQKLIDTTWDQSDPYNRKCPYDGARRSVTGCVATSVSQVMKYYEFPSCGTGLIDYYTESKNIHVTANLANYPFAWSSMLNNYVSGSFTSTQANAVANLMFAVGAATEMDYTYNGSGTGDFQAMNALVYNFGYDKDICYVSHNATTDEMWNNIIVNELNNNHPLYFSGVSGSGGGHAFVADGYEVRNSNIYYHFNWGWGGYCDGFFIYTDLNPTEQGIGGSDGAYNYEQGIFYNMFPDNGSNDGTYTFQASDVRCGSSYFESSQKVSLNVEISDIYNYCYSTFNGELRFYLVRKDGSEEYLRNYPVSGLASLYGWSKLTIPLNIGVLADGNYRIKVTHKANGSAEMPVLIPNQVEFTVGNSEVDDPSFNPDYFIEDFESYESNVIFANGETCGDWRAIDLSQGSTYGWSSAAVNWNYTGSRYAFGIIDFVDANLAGFVGASGTKAAIFMSEAYHVSDKYMISPALSGEAQTISFMVRPITAQYGSETFEVLASSTDDRVESFTLVSRFSTAVENWTKVTASLPEGTRHFAIHYTSNDIFGLFVDDVTFIKKKVSSCTPGDVNDDGSIDVSDIAATANYILGNNPEGFVKDAADVDQDGTVDVADIAGIANLILYGPQLSNVSRGVDPLAIELVRAACGDSLKPEHIEQLMREMIKE